MPETHWNIAWVDRPPEEARNLNPAFCAELILHTVAAFYKGCQAPLNMAVAFLVLPLTLHKPTRDALPGRADAAFAAWVAEKDSLLAEFPERVSCLRPISREALLFAMHYQFLVIYDGGFVPRNKPIRLTSKLNPSTDDVDEARTSARFLGRWFACQASERLILQGFGVTP